MGRVRERDSKERNENKFKFLKRLGLDLSYHLWKTKAQTRSPVSHGHKPADGLQCC